MSRIDGRVRAGLLGLIILGSACGERGVDWSAPENRLLRENTTSKGDAVLLEYWSLLDAPCQPIYDALADHYADFIPGVDTSQLVAQTENSKTTLIAQRVVSRQVSAKVEWTLGKSPLRIDFRTLTSDFAFNDGSYEFEASPDGKRCVLKTSFLVKPAAGEQAPSLAAVSQATRAAFPAAVEGVRKRAGAAAK